MIFNINFQLRKMLILFNLPTLYYLGQINCLEKFCYFHLKAKVCLDDKNHL